MKTNNNYIKKSQISQRVAFDHVLMMREELKKVDIEVDTNHHPLDQLGHLASGMPIVTSAKMHSNK
jgi:hypothetical protein